MIKKASILRYRKIKEIDLDFTNGVNVISGTNGTCKTSLLHIVSNSFQAVTRNCNWINDTKCIAAINTVNSVTNPKIESLSKGDKEHNDPANGHQGTIYTIDYINHKSIHFRKHNSKINNRYAVKPYYQRGAKESLPFCPVIYLGLARLFPFGEFQNDEAIKEIKQVLPIEYQQEAAELYYSFTHVRIKSSIPQKMGDIKMRADFSSDAEGIDSNTISAGEDNLYMLLTALVSLKYYYNSIASSNEVESILLVDEFDATLHPSYQFKLLELCRQYSAQFKIQVICTTHSLSLLEFALKKKDNVIYLIDNITDIHVMDTPDIYKIKMFLHDLTRDDIYINKVIPVFTEDSEARVFLKILLDYYSDTINEFARLRRFFHVVNASIGAPNLISMFNDFQLIRSTMRSICILDGDQFSQRTLDKHLTVLPGKSSPEKLIMDYAIELYENNDSFWVDETILQLNYGKAHFLSSQKPDIDNIEKELQELKDTEESTHGVERRLRKKVFADHQAFFELVFKHWVNNSKNAKEVERFYNDLHIMFNKVSEFHGINPKEWPFR